MAEPRRIYRTIARAAQQRPPSNAAFSAAKDRGTDSLGAPSVAGAAPSAQTRDRIARSRQAQTNLPEPPAPAGKLESESAPAGDDARIVPEAPRQESPPPPASPPKRKAKRGGKANGDAPPPTPADVIRARRRRCADAADIGGFLTKLVAMAALLACLFGLAFGVTPMENDDMAPRISAGDLLLYYRLADDWVNGDVMVFAKDGEQYVGRIVARGGDTVEVTDQATLVVNGSTVLENNIFYTTPKYDNGPTYPLTLADGEFFVLCDYREGARDSRYFGPVTAAEVKGKVITVVRRSNL